MIADQAVAVPNASVRFYKISNDQVVFEDFFMTDQEGKSEYVPLYAPPKELALDVNSNVCPYEVYNIEVRLTGYEIQEVVGVQIFAGQYSYLPIPMIPNQTRTRNSDTRCVDAIPDHHVFTDYGGNNQEKRIVNPERYVMDGAGLKCLNQVIIPKNITVHLGRPDRNAENLTVPFIYYLKNCASSEIYPTWPYEALKANILAQISLVLNRIHTAWYSSKGYDFDITNSSVFDQAFVKNRNIFDSIANIVDEIFNEYIQKSNEQSPLAQYAQLQQWGTLDLAQKGYASLDILKYYYGDSISIVECKTIEGIEVTYPNIPLCLGHNGSQIQQLQEQLNTIASNYTKIEPLFPVNGMFDEAMQRSVRAFQRQCNLVEDGVIEKKTYYKICYLYAAIQRLTELKSIGQINKFYNGEWPGNVFREGSKGVEVQLLQYYIASIAVFYKEIPPVQMDAYFGVELEKAILAFQKKFGLIQDGIVGLKTWNRIYEVFFSFDTTMQRDLHPAYPQTCIEIETSGEVVTSMQSALNMISSQYPAIPVVVNDGVFGSATESALRSFQRIFGLHIDGIIGPITWDTLFTTANKIDLGDQIIQGLPPFPGTVLRVHSTGNEVLFMQSRLKSISIYYTSIPTFRADSVYGKATQFACIAFQNLLGIPADGLIGKQTWCLINQIYDELLS